ASAPRQLALLWLNGLFRAWSKLGTIVVVPVLFMVLALRHVIESSESLAAALAALPSVLVTLDVVPVVFELLYLNPYQRLSLGLQFWQLALRPFEHVTADAARRMQVVEDVFERGKDAAGVVAMADHDAHAVLDIFVISQVKESFDVDALDAALLD